MMIMMMVIITIKSNENTWKNNEKNNINFDEDSDDTSFNRWLIIILIKSIIKISHVTYFLGEITSLPM